MTTKPTIEFLADILARKAAPAFLRVMASTNNPLNEEDILAAVNSRLREEGKSELTVGDAKKHLQFLEKKGLVKADSPESHTLSDFGLKVVKDLFPI
jgi:hypothetical protein